MLDALFGTELSATVTFAIGFSRIVVPIVGCFPAARRFGGGLTLEHLSSRRQA